MTDKKADTWMPLWIGAYLADTMSLTTIQHGAYLLLLIAYWRERKALLDDDEELRAITKLDRSDWKRMRPKIATFFKVDGGVWWHKRVEAEIVGAQARAKKATEKAEKAAQARWGDRDKHAASNAPSMPEALHEGMLDECPPPSPTPSPSGNSEANASDGKPSAGQPEKPKSPEDAAKADVWRAAVDVLQAGGCASEATCRSFMGKLVSDYTFELVREAVAIAASNQPADAREYLKATCMRLKGERAQDHGKPLTVPANAAAAAAQAAADAEHRKRAEEIAAITPEQRAAIAQQVRDRAAKLKAVA